MKNNYNPYTVPDNFFETVCSQAVEKHRCRRRAILYGAAAAIVAVSLICVPLFTDSFGRKLKKTEMEANNLAGMYEYDIFLQVNFTE